MRPMRLALFALSIVALAGCASISRAPAGPLKVGASQVTLGRDWSDVSVMVPNRPKKVRVLSIDGPMLNRLYVSDALSPGDAIVRSPAKERRTPVIRADMSATERMEFVADSVSAMGYQRVETSSPRPGAYGGRPAVVFDISAKAEDGLDIAGRGLVALIDGKTHVLIYVAPAEHYFAANLTEVEQVFASAQRR